MFVALIRTLPCWMHWGLPRNPPAAGAVDQRNVLLDASGAVIHLIGVGTGTVLPADVGQIATDDGATVFRPNSNAESAALTPQYAAEFRNRHICRDVVTEPPTQVTDHFDLPNGNGRAIIVPPQAGIPPRRAAP